MINGSNCNGPGVVELPVDRRRDMACFDALPKALRDALNNAVLEYAVTPLAQRIVGSVWPEFEARAILADIEADNRRHRAATSRRHAIAA